MLSDLKGRGDARFAGILAGSIVIGVALVMVLLPVASVASFGGPLTAATQSICSVGTEPWKPAYDPVDHEVYVPNFESSNVTVLKGTCTIAATINLPAGAYPMAAAFDPMNNHVYVTGSGLNEVYVISGTKLVKTIKDPSFDQPRGVAFDPADAVMCVTNYLGDTVSFIDLFNDVAVVSSVGDGPMAIDYDPYWVTLNVVNLDSDNVTVFDASTLGHIADVPVGSAPQGIAFDPVDDTDYIANWGSDNVSLLTYTSVALSIPGLDQPGDVAWSQAKLALYIPNEANGQVSVITGGSVVRTISTADGVAFAAYDEFNDNVYVADLDSNTVYVVTK